MNIRTKPRSRKQERIGNHNTRKESRLGTLSSTLPSSYGFQIDPSVAPLRRFCLFDTTLGMNVPRLVVALAAIALSLPALAEPKAYELVRYRGTADGITIAFDFGDGYPEASEIRITAAGQRKSTRFVLDASGEMRFVPEKARSSGDAVILKMSMDDRPGAKVEGTYRAAGKTIPFTLTKR